MPYAVVDLKIPTLIFPCQPYTLALRNKMKKLGVILWIVLFPNKIGHA